MKRSTATNSLLLLSLLLSTLVSIGCDNQNADSDTGDVTAQENDSKSMLNPFGESFPVVKRSSAVSNGPGGDSSAASSQSPAVTRGALTAPTVIKTFMMGFGDSITTSELEATASYVEDAFLTATDGLVALDITVGGTAPFPEENWWRPYSSILDDYPDFDTHPDFEEDDLARVWYYYRPYVFRSDVRSAVQDMLDATPEEFDMIWVHSEAQFDSIGFYSYSALPEPSIWTKSIGISGWASGNPYLPYSKKSYADNFVADEAIHETGHYMGLAHSCDYCNECVNWLCLERILDLECCQTCLEKDDVMSYCRHRAIFPSDPYNVFADCNLDYIETEFQPRFAQWGTGAMFMVESCD